MLAVSQATYRLPAQDLGGLAAGNCRLPVGLPGVRVQRACCRGAGISKEAK